MFGKKEKEKEKEKERKMMMMKLYNCDTGNKRKKGKKRRSVLRTSIDDPRDRIERLRIKNLKMENFICLKKRNVKKYSQIEVALYQ